MQTTVNFFVVHRLTFRVSSYFELNERTKKHCTYHKNILRFTLKSGDWTTVSNRTNRNIELGGKVHFSSAFEPTRQ